MDALAPRGEEGRGKLRKATASGQRALTRGCPNGVTPPAVTPGDGGPKAPEKGGRGPPGNTRGSETSQYPEEQKEQFDSVSSGERSRKSPNPQRFFAGVEGPPSKRDPQGLG